MLNASGQTLREKLQTRENAGSTKVTPEIKKEFAKGIEAIRAAKIVEGAKKVGDSAPNFTLKNATGTEITLSAELKKGPVALT